MDRSPAARQPLREARTLLPLFALVSALFAAGCASAISTPRETAPLTVTAVAASPTSSAPPATATPDAAALLADGGTPIIEAAYNRLLDEYIDPADPAALLEAAWSAVRAKADTLGLPAPAAPAFAHERVSTLQAFRAAYVRLAAGMADSRELRAAAVRGMAQSLHDCHTFFLGPVASQSLEGTRSGKGTIGVGIDLAGVPPLVIEVVHGSPAERAGVLVGDRVAGIDGADASALGPAGAFDRINGPEGTSVRLQLRRAGSDALVDVTMRRQLVTPANIETRLLGPDIGYVHVRTFVDGGVRQGLAAALAALDGEGARHWIIDLRDNPGGQLDTDAISLFVKDGVVVRERGRDGRTEEHRASGAVLPSLHPLVLLTDNRTGSVAEVFAAALKEYHVAYVIGARTNGCAGYTNIQPLGDGSSLAVTTHVNLGPVSGAALSGTGVTPDETVARTAADIAAARDPQLDAAAAYLRAR